MNRVQKIKKLKAGFKFYKNSFDLHPPYLILCDSNFLFAAIDSNISLEETFKSVFKGQIYLKVSNCALHELDLTSAQIKGPTMSETKRFAYTKCQKFKCSHPPKKPSLCIYQALHQGFQGCVCTQDKDLRRKIHRDFPKIPVFFIANQSVVIVPPPKSLREKVKIELMEKYAPQALKKESTEPQEDIKVKNNGIELDEEEEEEEAKDEISENNSIDTKETSSIKNDQKSKKHYDIDVLQNDEEDEKTENTVQEEKITDDIKEDKTTDDTQQIQNNDEENSKGEKKRRHRHKEKVEQQSIEDTEEKQNPEEISQTENLQDENNDGERKKRKKRHHTKPDAEN